MGQDHAQLVGEETGCHCDDKQTGHRIVMMMAVMVTMKVMVIMVMIVDVA